MPKRRFLRREKVKTYEYSVNFKQGFRKMFVEQNLQLCWQCTIKDADVKKDCIWYSVIAMIEKWRNVDKYGSFGFLKIDLSKVFDYIGHDLLIGKLYTSRFSVQFLNFINKHLVDRKQRTNVDNGYSWFQNIGYIPLL